MRGWREVDDSFLSAGRKERICVRMEVRVVSGSGGSIEGR